MDKPFSSVATPLPENARLLLVEGLDLAGFSSRLENNVIVVQLCLPVGLGRTEPAPTWDCAYIWTEQGFWCWKIASARWFGLFLFGESDDIRLKLKNTCAEILRPFLEDNR